MIETEQTSPFQLRRSAMMTTEKTQWIVLDQAHEALRSVVRSASDQDWDAPSPCEGWTIAQVLQHAAGDQLGFASIITGEPGPTENPFAPSGVLSAAPLDVLEPALQAAASAWATIAPDAEDAPTPLPQGAMAAPTAVGACALDAAVHAWDIAVATGQPSPLTPELARTLLAVAVQIVEPLRSYGAYAAAIEDDAEDDTDGDNRDAVTALLHYLGRRADWTP
jgi:uncharacterized protein (TIGR03086 family)